jgi:hypothetical protein
MTPGLRKFVLTAHVTSSVGWLGAVAGFLALAIAGLTNQDTQMVRAAYLGMELLAWFVIVPLAFASLLTGLVQSLGTPWGLFRHYWVLTKLLITVLATIVLLVKMKLIGFAARLAADTTLSHADLRVAGIQLAVHAAGGLLVLLVITTLSVFKPWGRTRYGLRKQLERRERAGSRRVRNITAAQYQMSPQTIEGSISISAALTGPDEEPTVGGRPFGLKILLALIGALVVGFVVLHLTGGGLDARSLVLRPWVRTSKPNARRDWQRFMRERSPGTSGPDSARTPTCGRSRRN